MSVQTPSAAAAARHAEALHARNGMRASEHALAKVLARIHAEKDHHEYGYANVVDYAVAAFDLDPRKAAGLLRLGRSLDQLPVLDQAWAQGDVSWTKARDMLKVLTPDNEAAWVERARHTSSRDLEADLDRTLMGELPPTGASRAKDPSRQRLVFHVDSSDAEVIRTVLQWARSQLGEDSDDVTDGEILASVMQRVMHDVPSESAPTAERFRIVVQHCPDCARTEGPDCELTEAVVEEAGCDAEVVELRDGPARGHLTHTIPPAVRRTVLHRDGCRCRVPGCNNRLFLDLHHLRHRRYGGRHDVANLLSVCSLHHKLLHEGRLAAEPVPGGVRFTFPSGRTVTSRLEPVTARAAWA